jgi:hypothetical protein
MLNASFTVDVKQSIELLKTLIDHADTNSRLILEGNLSQFDGRHLAGAVREDAKDGLDSSYGRVTIPLAQENRHRLKTAVLPRVGIRSLIARVFLETENTLLFASSHKFTDGALFSDWITAEFLAELEQLGIVKLTNQAQQNSFESEASEKTNYETIYNADQSYGGYSNGQH